MDKCMPQKSIRMSSRVPVWMSPLVKCMLRTNGDWWKGVDALSQRRRSSSINLDINSLVRLNDYFANLCYDDSYVRPIDMDIPDSVRPPEISERCVCGTL
ncbi:unnamed protein product [Porites evermanni]|uniref:Uncharacterized protein n=1 Tax=Porites evermanni TaxID=104178 RepID=A0ABN8MLD1_9CNID|nr:unnamed protein product [Porites evermanni]